MQDVTVGSINQLTTAQGPLHICPRCGSAFLGRHTCPTGAASAPALNGSSVPDSEILTELRAIRALLERAFPEVKMNPPSISIPADGRAAVTLGISETYKKRTWY